MVGGGVGCLSPDPDNMEATIRSQYWSGRVGIALAFTVVEWAIEKAAPSTSHGIIDIIVVAAIATTTITIAEQQIAFAVFEEIGIGYLVFVFARHAIDALQGGNIKGDTRAVVDEGVRVHVARKVQATVAVEGKLEAVVGIPPDGIGRMIATGDRAACGVNASPLVVAQFPAGDRDAPVGGVVSNELMPALGE